MRAATQRGAPA